jgi:hypothetical protein
VRWFHGIAILIMSSTTYDASAQQKVQAGPTVSDRACSFAELGPKKNLLDSSQSDSASDATSAAISTVRSLNAQEKLICYARISYSWASFVGPLFPASKKMMFPPSAYPPHWKQGVLGFALNYDDSFTNDTANRAGRYASAIILREDTRYWPSEDGRPFHRVLHLICFALVDKSDSGSDRLAISNLVGAAAGGFIGNSYLPKGYNDVTHAGQRSAIQLAESPLPNLVCEFTPELSKAAKWAHLPFLNNTVF